MRLHNLCFAFLLLVLSVVPAQADSYYEEIVSFGRGVPYNVFWHPDGNSFFVHTQANTLWQYDSTTFTEMAFLDDVHFVYVSPNQRWLVTRDMTNAWTLREIGDELRVAITGLRQVNFSARGTSIIVYRDGEGFSILNGDSLQPAPQQPVFGATLDTILIWSPDEQLIAEVAPDGTFKRWHAASTTLEATFVMPERARFDRWRWNPDNVRLLNSDADGNVRVWDTMSGEIVLAVPGAARQAGNEDSFQWVHLEWNPSGSLFVRCYVSGDYTRCDGRNSAGELVGEFTGGVGSPQFSPDEQWMATGSGIYDANTLELYQAFDVTFGGDWLYWSEDSSRILQNYAVSPEIGIYNLSTRSTQVRFHGHLQEPQFTIPFANGQWSPDNQRVFSWDRYGLIILWDANSGAEIERIEEHIAVDGLMRFASDGSLIAVSDTFGNIYIWETESGTLKHRLSGHQFALVDLEWQPNGRLLASMTDGVWLQPNPPDGRAVFVWDTDAGELVDSIWHRDIPSSFAWSLDGSVLATAEYGKIHLWDARTHTVFEALPMNRITVTELPQVIWGPNPNVLSVRYTSGSHGASGMEFWQTPGYRSLFHPIFFVGHDYLSWSPDQASLRLPNLHCRTTHFFKGYDCEIAINTLFSTEQAIGPVEDFRGPTPIDPIDFAFGSFSIRPTYSWSPNGQYLFAKVFNRGEVWFIEHDGARLISSFDLDGPAHWSPDSAYIVVLSRNIGIVTIIDATTGRKYFAIEGYDYHRWANDYLITTGVGDNWQTQTQQIWDVANATLYGEYPFRMRAFSHDLNYGAGSISGIFRLWRLR